MIKYQIIDTPLGDVVIGGREGKICFCHFALPSLEAALERVAADFPGEEIVQKRRRWEYSLQELLCGRGSIFRWEDFLLKGTPLQLAVWREIYNLLPDELISYSALAARCGYPKAVRAVATAVGKNPISLIIPCHRVLRMEAFPKDWVKDGSICVESLMEKSGKEGSTVVERVDSMIDKEKLGNYEWGKELKRRILEWEGLI